MSDFVEPTSISRASDLKAGAMASKQALVAVTGTASKTKSAPCTACAMLSSEASITPMLSAFCRDDAEAL